MNVIFFYLSIQLILNYGESFRARHVEKRTRSTLMDNKAVEVKLNNNINNNDRRSLLQISSLIMLGKVIFTTTTANAAMENTQNVFKAGQQLTKEEAENRLRDGRKSVQYLLDHYDEICEGGGDNVRRYLGTVGTSSGLYGIAKVMKTLSDQADDIVAYTETAAEVEKCIQQADGSAYMAIFVTTSTSYDPPSKYFSEAKIEVKRCVRALDDLANLINLKY